MGKCQNCGQLMEDGELFCSNCGNPVRESGLEERELPAFCPNCGAKMEAESFFCGNCGTDIRSGIAPPAETASISPAEKTNTNNKKVGLIVTGVVAVAVVLLLVKVTGGLFSPPVKKFASYQRAFLVDKVLTEIVNTANYWNDYTISTDMTLTAESGSREVNYFLDDSQIALNVDLGQKRMQANAALTLMDSEIVSGTANYEAGKFSFCVPELDDTYYTVDLVQMADLINMDLTGLEKAERIKIPTDLIQKIGKRYIDIVLNSVNADNLTVNKEKKIRFHVFGGSETGTVYTFRPDADDVETLVITLADTIEKDKQLREFVTSMIGNNRELYSSLYPDFDIESNVDEALLDLAEHLRDNAENIGENVESSDFQWVLCVSGKKISKISLETENGYYTYGYENKGNKFALYAANGDFIQSLELEYEKKDDGYSGKVSVNNGYDDAAVLGFKNVKKTKSALGFRYGTYTFSADGGRIELDVKKGDKGGTDHVMEVSGIPYIGDITVTLHTTDKKATISSPKGKAVDISDYDLSDLAELSMDWERAAEDLVSDLSLQQVMEVIKYLW